MTTSQLIEKAESLGITSGYKYPGFATLCRADRVALVQHFAAPVVKNTPAPVSADEDRETLAQMIDRIAPVDDMPHRFDATTR